MTKFRLSGLRALSLLLVGASLLGLSACNPTGNGTGPIRLAVNAPNGAADADTGKAYVCLRSGLTATLFFDSGSAADFTSRVTWTSSNPAVVRVSNVNDEPLPSPSTGFFLPGVLTPVSPGTAVVTASFSGFSDSITITVGTPSSYTILAKNPQTNIPAPLLTPGAIRMAPNSIIDLDVLAVLDGLPVTVDAAAAWSFVTPNTNVAAIDAGSGVIIATATAAPTGGTPLTARVSFPACAGTASATTIDTTVTVAPLTAVTITPQFGSDPLVVGNTEGFTVLGDFGSGPEQDLSVQAVFTSSTPAVAAFNGLPGITNVLSALTAGTVTVSATFTSAGTAVTSPPLTVTTQTDTLTGISIAPTTLNILAGASTITPLTVTGTYASLLTQVINRRTLFSSDNTAVAVVSNNTQTSGQVASGGSTTGTATITASVANPADSTAPFTATTTVTAANPAP